MIVLISDLDLQGSGYMNIAIGSAKELAARGKRVTVLGFGYKGEEHNWPFQIIPVNISEAWAHTPAMMHNIVNMGHASIMESLEAVIVALDIPWHERGLQVPRMVPGGYKTPYIGIFPIESGPLTASWANTIRGMDGKLVISKYGLKMMRDAGIPDGIHYPVGLDADAWRPPSKPEREAFRKSLGMDDDTFVVLTVADNQERKNLSATAKAISILKHTHKVKVTWLLVTRVNCPVGWKLFDLFHDLDITENVQTFERGLPHERLWILHAASDAFVLTSKAEGLCMPLLEAMSVGTPVAATYCTAIKEHLFEEEDAAPFRPLSHPKGQRGFPIPVEYEHVDPWGNSVRSYASPQETAKVLLDIWRMDKKKMEPIVGRAMDYAHSRQWSDAGDVLAKVIRTYAQSAKESQMVITGPEPSTVPQALPDFGIPQERRGDA